MLLKVLSRKDDGCRAMQHIIARCHESPKAKQAHIKRGWQLFRSLLDRKIIEIVTPDGISVTGSTGRQPVPSSNPMEGVASVSHALPPNGELVPACSIVPVGRSPTGVGESLALPNSKDQIPLTSAPKRPKLRVNVELQDDFSMDQTLSLYLIETIPLVDPQQPDYALVLLTLVESILEDPDLVLRKQLDKVKSQKMAEMKQQGLEYEARMEELEKLEYPKPNREFIYSTFNAFADRHPWVGQENIRPKSIAREMFESFRSFSDYIRDYELQRAEGILLRHLNSVFKVLAQTVPDSAKNEQVREMELYLGSMIRQVDSSLLDEWAKMRDPNYQRAETKEVRPPGAEEADKDITRDTKAFTAMIRNRIFTFLRGLVIGDLEQALAHLSSTNDPNGQPWTAERLNQALDAYHSDHERICLDPNARN